MPARIILLVTSPRLPAGLLTAAAWDAVRQFPVFTAAESEQTEALRHAGVPVAVIDPNPDRLLAEISEMSGKGGGAGAEASADVRGSDAAAGGSGAGPASVVWLAGPAGDQDFARQLGLRLTREPDLAELELMYGSWDPPGARLLDAVAVMDRLASPGGDPWKRAQTHRSLAQYMLEEAYEAFDAIEADDLTTLREELGDVLLQVVLHARLAEELPDGAAWGIDDVAGGLVEKMVRRNPHVFAGEDITDIDEITANWERIKKAEKARDSVLDGIALSQPALSLAAKILQRAERAGLDVPLPTGDELGPALLRVVAQAQAAAVDAEAELRRTTLTYAEDVRSAERGIVGPAE